MSTCDNATGTECKSGWTAYSVIAAIVFAFVLSGDAIAKTKPKARPVSVEPAVSTAIQLGATAPVRFFTINQVLAKRDGQIRGDAVKLAAIDTTTATDTPSPSMTKLQPTSDEPFGLFTFGAPQGLLWTKWRRVQEQIRDEAQVLETCRAHSKECSSLGARTLLAIVADAQKRTGRARIEVVNRLVNASIRYTSDYAQHGVLDLWSAPIATLTAGRGDCEDYAIAKYVALREAGAPDVDLRLLLVRDRAAGQDHAVLAVRHDGSWLILDNRHGILNVATEVPQLTPLFALDHQGVKLFAAPYTAVQPAQDAADALAPAAETVTSAGDMTANDSVVAISDEDAWGLHSGPAELQEVALQE